MAHYAMLRDYHFAADVDDIRGASVYGPGNEKLGTVKDVIFNHENGEVRYLVLETARHDKHLLPASQVYRSVEDENDFDTNLTRTDMENLPVFDEKTMASDQEWKDYEKRHAEAYKRLEQRQEQQYEKEWHAEPVQHRRGSTHDITPEADEIPPAQGSGVSERVISGADLTPQRLAGKFPDTAPGGDKITASIAGTPARAADAAHTNETLSPRWDRFRESLRREAANIREHCPSCCSRAA